MANSLPPFLQQAMDKKSGGKGPTPGAISRRLAGKHKKKKKKKNSNTTPSNNPEDDMEE